MAETIVIGYDGTDASQRALERAATLAPALGGSLVVASVAPVVTTSGGRSVGADPVEPASEHLAELAAARSYLEGRGLTAEYVEALGHEGEGILAVAADRSAAMIVIGGHEPSLLRRLIGHRIDDTVAHGARCDVLIVH